MLQTILDVILYIPRKIYRHFEYMKRLEKENKRLEQNLKRRKILLRKIISECNSTAYSNYENKIRKIKELAQMFPNNTY